MDLQEDGEASVGSLQAIAVSFPEPVQALAVVRPRPASMLARGLGRPDGLSLVLGHVPGMAIEAEVLDLPDAGRPVGAQKNADEFGHEVVELAAVHGIRVIGAVRARGAPMLHTAGPDLAPGRLPVLAATGTAALQVGAARSAVKPAVGDEFRIGSDGVHSDECRDAGNEVVVLRPGRKAKGDG